MQAAVAVAEPLIAGGGGAFVGGEVEGRRDARLAVLGLEVGVSGGDAAVEDGDADALAGDAGGVLDAGLRERRAGGLAGDGHLGADHAVGRDVGHVLALGQRGERAAGHERRHGVERLEVAALGTALGGDGVGLRGVGAALGLDDDADEFARRARGLELGSELRGAFVGLLRRRRGGVGCERGDVSTEERQKDRGCCDST